MPVDKKRVAYFDVLNILACFAVVALHVNGSYWNYRPSPSWIINLFNQKSFYWAVPVFYMLTGATLLSSFEWSHLGSYIKKRFLRAVIPFLAWSVIGLLFGIYVTGYVPYGENPAYYIELVVNTSIPTEDILWFMIPLFSIYIAIPLYALVPKELRGHAYSYIIVAYFIVTALIQVLAFAGVSVGNGIVSPLSTGWLVYPLMGYLLANNSLSKRQRQVFYFAGILGWSVMFFGTLFQSQQAGELVHFASGGVGLPSVFLGAAVFLAIKTICENNEDKLTQRIRTILAGGARLTFGVYLSHMFVLTLLIRIFHIQEAAWWWGLVGVPVLFAISLSISALLNRLPLFRRIV